MNERMTLKMLKAEIHRMDPKLPEGDPAFNSALVMLATLKAGTNADAIARFTGLPRAYVRARAKRLRETGIWTRGNQLSCEWFGKDGGVSFWADSLVLDGLLERVPAGAA